MPRAVSAAGWPSSPSSLLCDGQERSLTFSSVWQRRLWGHPFFLCKDGCRWNTFLRCKRKWGGLTIPLKRSAVLGHGQGAACILGATQLQGRLKKSNEEPSGLYMEGMQANPSVHSLYCRLARPSPSSLVAFHPASKLSAFLLHSCVVFLHLEAAASQTRLVSW